MLVDASRYSFLLDDTTTDNGGYVLPSPTILSNRIVGGHDADRTLYPWYALLQIARENSFGVGTQMVSCGATLIAPEILLTAAHCFAEPALEINVFVNATTFSGTGHSYFRIGEQVKLHPEYSRSAFKNDIAIIKLSSPVPDAVSPVILNRDADLPVDGAALQVIGMGVLEEGDAAQFPEQLQVVTLESINIGVCQEQNKILVGVEVDGETKICAGAKGKDSCQGDR